MEKDNVVDVNIDLDIDIVKDGGLFRHLEDFFSFGGLFWELVTLMYEIPGGGAGWGTWRACCYSHFTEFIYELVLERQLLHKIVNLLLSFTY